MGYVIYTLATIASFFAILVCANGNDAAAEVRLRERLLNDHPGVMVRSVADKEQRTNVTIGFDLKYLKGFDVENNILTLNGYLNLMWNDKFLQWDADVEGVDSLRMSADDIWIPDIRAYDTVGEDVSETLMFVSPSGSVKYVRPSTVEIACTPMEDAEGFYDCNLMMGSWTYNEHLIKLISRGPNTSAFKENPHWNIWHISTSQYSEEFECCPGAYSVWRLSLALERR